MKIKTSITLDESILAEIDALAAPHGSRSAFIENVLRDFLRERKLAAADARDFRRLNRHAERLNAEAADVREYQAPWQDE